MTATSGHSPARRSQPFRIAGGIILLLGVIIAALVFFLGDSSMNDVNNPSLDAYNKSARYSTEVNYGSAGIATHNFLTSLAEPAHLALVILIAAVFIALVCFYIATMLDNDARRRN